MDGCLGVICFVESFPMLTYILDPNLNGCKAAQNGICLIPADVFFSLHIQILLGLFILKITVQATDNNFVGGDVIPNYLESYFFLPKNHILVLSDYLFVNECLVLCCLHLFVFHLWQDIDIACMFIFSYLQFVGMRHFLLLC